MTMGEEDRRKDQAEQIIRAARAGGSVRIKDGKVCQLGGVDFDLLRSSGALQTPTDQERSGMAHNKARRQAGNARRLMGSLWRYLVSRVDRKFW